MNTLRQNVFVMTVEVNVVLFKYVETISSERHGYLVRFQVVQYMEAILHLHVSAAV